MTGARPGSLPLLLLVLLQANLASAAGEPGGARQALSVLRFTLDNGLEVVLQPDRWLPLVTVSVVYHVGTFHELAGRSGMARLAEHLMFEGSQHVPAHLLATALDQAGAEQAGGVSSLDRTSYSETLSAVNLETALWIESDRMGFLLEVLDGEKLRAAKQRLRNERHEQIEAAPYGLAREKLWQALFPRPHPYHDHVLGAMADLDAVTLEDVRGFFRTWVVPGNATLTLSGDFDGATAKGLVRKYFATLPARPRAAAVEVVPVTLEHEVVIDHMEEVGTLPLVVMAWHAPPVLPGGQDGQHGDEVAEVLGLVLSASRACPLPRSLTGRRGQASSVSVTYEAAPAQSVFQISVLARPGADLEEVTGEIDAVLDEIRDGGVTEGEIARARALLRTRRLAAAEAISSGAEVTPDEVARFARDVLVKGRRVLLYAVPRPAGSRDRAP